MTIRPRGNSFEVTVNRASALPGYRRIRRLRPSLEAATSLEAEILDALTMYGKWPVLPEDRPLVAPTEQGRWSSTQANLTPAQHGTLREAAHVALKSHYHGKAWYKQVSTGIWPVVTFFENLGVPDLDHIESHHVDDFVDYCRAKGNAPSTINKALGFLRVMNDVALDYCRPPLCTVKIPTKHQSDTYQETWWLKPEDHPRAIAFLIEQGDDLFADLLDTMLHQGFRVRETLRLSTRSFTGLQTDAPWVKVPGTKTKDAQNSMPVYPETIPVIERCLTRATANGWNLLFPITERQASNRWNKVRAFLGVSDVKTATLRALRRTFAWYANNRGMPTATLKEAMRHKDIKTTDGYLKLIGGGAVADSRKYFQAVPQVAAPIDCRAAPTAEQIKIALQAFMATGASPEELARFAKELML